MAPRVVDVGLAFFAGLATAVLGGCGIDGTGVQAPDEGVLAYGRITDFGSVWVNGERYDIGNADFAINGAPGSESDLKIGDVVLVDAQWDSATSKMVAKSIVLDDLLLAPIDSIDAANGTISSLGQTVTVNEHTVFDFSIPQGLAGLANGDVISVSGFRTALGAIVATNVARPALVPTVFKTIGAVTALSNDELRFNINALEVDYSEALPDPGFPPLARGDIVEVKGTLLTPTTLKATSYSQRFYIGTANAPRQLNIEGFITKLNSTDSDHFDVAGLPVVTNDQTVIDGNPTLDSSLQAEGMLDPTGALMATRVSSIQATPGLHTVSGYVYDPYAGPIAASINFFVTTPTFGYSYWMWHHGPLLSDETGHFEATAIHDNSEVTILAFTGEYVQPCAAVFHIDHDTTVDIEMMAVSALNSLDPPRPQSSHGASLSGNVYEMTETGQQPVVGARILAGNLPLGEIYAAMTFTDLRGNYFLCNLPPVTALWVEKPGFADEGNGFSGTVIFDIDTSQSTTLDVELHRP